MDRARSVRARMPRWVPGWCLAVGVLAPFALTQSAVAVDCTKYASTTGSDTAAGTLAAPYRTTQKLADSLTAGQVGCLSGGGVFGGVKVNRSGITLTSTPGGPRATLLGKTWIPDASNDVVIENLIINGRTSGSRVNPDVQGDRVVFRNNEITNDNTAICLHIGSNIGYGVAYDVVVEGNRIHNCGRLPATGFDHGIYVNNAERTRIVNNAIYDNSDYGVHLYPGARNSYIANNVIDGNGRGITFSGEGGLVSSGNLVENNIISNSLIRYNVESWWAAEIGVNNRAERNCLWNGRLGNVAAQVGFTATANIVADPLFGNRAGKDFTLQLASPCAGKGLLVAAPPPPPPSLPPDPDPTPPPPDPTPPPAPDPTPPPAPDPTPPPAPDPTPPPAPDPTPPPAPDPTPPPAPDPTPPPAPDPTPPPAPAPAPDPVPPAPPSLPPDPVPVPAPAPAPVPAPVPVQPPAPKPGKGKADAPPARQVASARRDALDLLRRIGQIERRVLGRNLVWVPGLYTDADESTEVQLRAGRWLALEAQRHLNLIEDRQRGRRVNRPQTQPQHGLPFTNETLATTRRLLAQAEDRLDQLRVRVTQR